MVDEKKIRIMTALAVYDKYYSKKDRDIECNYRRDYIYKKNCTNRICVTFGYFFLVALYFCYLIFTDRFSLADFDFMGLAKTILFIWLLLMAVYTVLGMFLYGREYDSAQRRLKSYQALLDRLEDYN